MAFAVKLIFKPIRDLRRINYHGKHNPSSLPIRLLWWLLWAQVLGQHRSLSLPGFGYWAHKRAFHGRGTWENDQPYFVQAKRGSQLSGCLICPQFRQGQWASWGSSAQSHSIQVESSSLAQIFLEASVSVSISSVALVLVPFADFLLNFYLLSKFACY